MTLRTVLRSVIGGRVGIHGFGASVEATGGRHNRGLELAWGRGRGQIVDRSLCVLRDGQARPDHTIDILIDAALLLWRVHSRVGRRQVRDHRGGLWDIGRRTRYNIVYVQVDIRRRLLLRLRLFLALLLEGCGDSRKDDLKLRLEGLWQVSQ